jgi:hypothetical protein
VQAAIREHAVIVRTFTTAHLPELYDGLALAAEAAAADVEHACRSLLETIGRRMAVEQQAFQLIALVRHPDPGAVAHTRTDAIRHAIDSMLVASGEPPPLLRDDPRHHPAAESEPEAAREPEPAAA